MALVPASRFPAGIWTADRGGSHIGFAVGHPTLDVFRGWFERFEVRLQVGEDGTASITGTVVADSIATVDGLVDGHLRSAELFDVDCYPDLTFASTLLRRDADRLEVDGLLTIKDRTLLVAGQGRLAESAAHRLGLDLVTVVDRRQFGLDWNRDLPGGVLAFGNEVTIETRLSLSRART